MSFSYAFIVIAIVVVIVIAKTATVVPQQSAYVIENLGKYSRTMQAGFHILVPFVERVAYRHSLKEQALDYREMARRLRRLVSAGARFECSEGLLWGRHFDTLPDRSWPTCVCRKPAGMISSPAAMRRTPVVRGCR